MKPRPEFVKIVLCALLALAAMVPAATDKVERDNGKISIFAQPAISFLNFDERKYFQNAVDTIYREFYKQALTESESLTVAKQDFQKVNFCFPLSAGLQFQPIRDNFLSLGISFIYDHESVVLTDRRNKSHNYEYTLQGTPLFLEYRLAIPRNLMAITDESLFSVAVRWYWVLPGTEIYSSWGKIDAETPPLGAGFGFSVGYLITSWKNFNIFGDVGYSSISVKSKKSYADIVPDGPTDKAKWNIGGLQLQIRVSFGLWNYPKIEDDSTAATAKDSAKVNAPSVASSTVASATDSAKTDSTITDTTKVTTDSTITDTAKTSAGSAIADTAKPAKESAATVDTSKTEAVTAKDTTAQSSTAKQQSTPASTPEKQSENAEKKVPANAPVESSKEPSKKDDSQKPAAVKATER